MNIKPLADYVLIESLKEEEKIKVGIFLPDTFGNKEGPEEGRVVAVGKGKKTDDGKVVPPSVKVGDKVLFMEGSNPKIKADGKEYIVTVEDDIIAIIG